MYVYINIVFNYIVLYHIKCVSYKDENRYFYGLINRNWKQTWPSGDADFIEFLKTTTSKMAGIDAEFVNGNF